MCADSYMREDFCNETIDCITVTKSKNQLQIKNLNSSPKAYKAIKHVLVKSIVQME